ncbi:TIGR04283 family arsenosugar biosynthesis glycosyltransferase [Waterburya agarophytonicola K14]|uniref:4,4'-diaponeurosporenoate glycosyltransferase n=1 Tax=Waterburya agarophytonicola KI4 TaxID=2874699 RepID=A0A964FIT3_9CYAN|nr:TIGR04283 family arsenosugar biosynthesis glycosyltransferase [Waterburya agarophytonicola]MCC0178333.1 TIGR04283 family arsenosugar biosynthesis glycosyltransferase [Waterburya agarophytonicola KI4]
MAQYTISIIIPVLNEAEIIQPTLAKLLSHGDLEIIVVDGGSKDNTVSIARSMGANTMTVSGGRSAQMNAGAKIAGGDILLFLHIDTKLPDRFMESIVETLQQPKVIAGAFELAIEGEDRSLRWVEMLVKVRSHLLSLPYGDQAIFITKQTFIDLGGFRDLPIMEDFELIQRLKRQGKIAIASDKVITSGRRWQKLGVWRTTLINQLIIIGYHLGISLHKLNHFYRSRGK